MQYLSNNLPFDQMITKWASTLNPFLGLPFNNVNILPSLTLKSGQNVINHLLGQMQQGWVIVDIQGPATIYRSEPFNSKTLSLTSSAAVTVTIGVF